MIERLRASRGTSALVTSPNLATSVEGLLNIGLVSPYDYASQGGVTEHIKYLSRELRAQGHRVKVLAPYSTDRTDVPPDVYGLGAVMQIPANGSVARISLSTDLRRTIRAILRTEDFDILHVHEPLMPAVPWFVLRHSTSVNIGTFHAYGDYSALYAMGRPFLRRLFARLHGLIAVSPSAYEFVSQYFGGDFEIMPNGVDVARFGADLPPIKGLRDGRPTVLFVGRFEEPRKGLRWLLQAIPLIEPFFPDLRLVVGGSGDPEEAAEWLPLRDYSRTGRTVYRSAGSALEVEFTGFISAVDLPRYYQSCDVYCAPSTGGESFGIVLLEAMAAGAPVLASRIPGYANVLTHGREGFLVEPRSPAALAAGIIRLLSDPTLRRQMGEAGKRTASQYDWPIVTRQVVSYYRQVLSRTTLTRKV
jgi:phosphatidyl-myo-inositol alpha-mannosyltransferase